MIALSLKLSLGIVKLILPQKMFFAIFAQNITKTVKKFGLNNSNFYEKRFEKILRSFLNGNNCVLSQNFSISTVRKKLDLIEPFYRGFAYEGTGMGFGIRSTFSLNAGKKFEKYINDLSLSHVYQYYVGLGWWLHIRYGFSKRGYSKWLRQLNSKLSPVLFDGVGFRTGLYQTHKISACSIWNDSEKRICHQGYGRSLWFRNQFNIESVLKDMGDIEKKYMNDTFSGIGLAVAYSLFDDIELGLSIKKKIPMRYQIAFLQGMAFGWETRRLQNDEYWLFILKERPISEIQLITQVIHLVHKTKKEINHVQSQDYYVRWMDQTRVKLKDFKGRD